MCDLLTFFRNRKQDGGREWRIEDGDVQLYFHSRTYLEGSAYLRELPPGVSFATYRAQIAEAIGQAGGGLLVEAKPAYEGWSLDITPVTAAEGEAYRPPPTVFSIEQGGELGEIPLKPEASTRLSLPAHAHLIVPVDLDAEEHFRSFRVHFSSWFPQDFESSMLNLLKRPSLDLRLERLERAYERQAAQGPAGFSLGKLLEGGGQTHWVWGGLGAAAGVLLTMLALGRPGHDQAPPTDTQAFNKEPEAAQAAAGKPAEPAPAPPPQPEPTPPDPAQTRALVQALENLDEALAKGGGDGLGGKECLIVYAIQQADADGTQGLKSQFQQKIPGLDFQLCATPNPEQAAEAINKLAEGLAQAAATKPAAVKPPATKPAGSAKPSGKATH